MPPLPYEPSLRSLRLARVGLTVRLRAPLAARELAGPALRSAFGVGLRTRVCATGAPTCAGCPLRTACAYGVLFDPAWPGGHAPRWASGGQDAPRPLVLEASPEAKGDLSPGALCRFTAVLIGRAVAYAPYIPFVFARLGAEGRGPGRPAPYTLEAVEAVGADGALAPLPPGALPPALSGADLLTQPAPPPGRLALVFRTPLRLEERGVPVEPTFPLLVRALLRRLVAFAALHGDEPLEAFDERPLLEAAAGIATDTGALRWVDGTRRSVRQGRDVPLGGYVGPLVIEGDLAPFLPLLAAGQWLHVGKGAVMGHGGYTMDPAPTAPVGGAAMRPGIPGRMAAPPTARPSLAPPA